MAPIDPEDSPAVAAYTHAQRFRRWFRDRLRDLFRDVDVLVTATTPYVAQPIGTAKKVVDGVEVLARGHLGVYTQPFSFIGLPALTVPMRGEAGLPLGVQLVAAPYREADLLRVAAWLEARGVVAAPRPPFILGAPTWPPDPPALGAPPAKPGSPSTTMAPRPPNARTRPGQAVARLDTP